MNTLVEKEIKIEDLIYEIRGKQVMLDSDLAMLYNVETKRINEAVIRNEKKFPERFCWKLSNDESKTILVAKCDQKIERRGGKYKNPRAFTEQGVMMLATILKSNIAVEVTIRIMDAFVAMKQYISNTLLEQKYINNLVLEDHEKIKLLEESFSKMETKNNHLFFKGQVYDAYSLLMDILNKSKTEIIIIDNYIDKSLLDVLRKTKKDVKIITNKYNNEDYTKYKKQYHNVDLIVDNTFHDRFIIIDRKELYHCGSSFKDLGKTCFELSRIIEPEMILKMLEMLSRTTLSH